MAAVGYVFVITGNFRTAPHPSLQCVLTISSMHCSHPAVCDLGLMEPAMSATISPETQRM